MKQAAALLALTVAGCTSHAGTPLSPRGRPALEPVASGVTALLQAVAAPSEQVAWASGHQAAVLQTTDGGETWIRLTVPGAAADSLEFRDVYAVDADSAYLLAAGPGSRSRIYKTTDGGGHWALQFINRDSSAFYDCFDFWSAERGVALSDGVGGRLLVLRTTDGGAHWMLPPSTPCPPRSAERVGSRRAGRVS